jgi:hypothetical protein
VLKAVGSRNGGLPDTIAYSSRGTLCATYSGALGADALAAIRGACRTRGD